jgi:hypothetical protein
MGAKSRVHNLHFFIMYQMVGGVSVTLMLKLKEFNGRCRFFRFANGQARLNRNPLAVKHWAGLYGSNGL